jgi:Icc-related predicted phosphoesterase
VAACGGAVSIDQGTSTPGASWFPEERISTADQHRVAAGGVADVLVCHDAPSGWAIPGVADPASFHESWQRHLPAAYEHRMILRAAYEAVQPRVVIHGHYHTRYRHLAEETWGTVVIDGLAGDGDPGAFVAIDCTDSPELRDVSISLL